MSETGYVYRIPAVERSDLQQLIGKIVGEKGWTFGGAALWDFEPVMKGDNLRSIKQIGQTYIDISGDFGHAFSQQAEVRWKRRSDDGYDVLVLSDGQQTIEGATQMGESWEVQTNDKLKIMQTGKGGEKLHYKTYHAPNGAVQFVRYTSIEGVLQ